MNVKQAYEINILFNCTYLETKINFMCTKMILKNEYATSLQFTIFYILNFLAEPLLSICVPPKFRGAQFGKHCSNIPKPRR
jgi:hypothetical protein